MKKPQCPTKNNSYLAGGGGLLSVDRRLIRLLSGLLIAAGVFSLAFALQRVSAEDEPTEAEDIETGVTVDTAFPDDHFAKWIKEHVSNINDGDDDDTSETLTQAEIGSYYAKEWASDDANRYPAGTQQMRISSVYELNEDTEEYENYPQKITDLTGIEYFSGLTLFSFVVGDVYSRGALESLDVSALTNLKILDVKYNNLNTLGVSALTNLEILDVGNNNLETLDVSALTKLKKLYCGKNKLEEISGLSERVGLEVLDCSYNSITALDLDKLQSLKELDCGGNPIKELDVLSLTNLEELVISDKGSDEGDEGEDGESEDSDAITTLDLRNMSNLKRFTYDGRVKYESDGDKSDGDKSDGDKSDGDKSGGDKSDGDKSGGDKSDGDKSGGDKSDGDKSDEDKSDEDFPAYKPMGSLKNLYLSGAKSLEEISIFGAQIKTLNLSDATDLKILYLDFTDLSGTLDLRASTQLEELSCDSNKFTRLDLTGLNSLKEVNCAYNYLRREAAGEDTITVYYNKGKNEYTTDKGKGDPYYIAVQGVKPPEEEYAYAYGSGSTAPLATALASRAIEVSGGLNFGNSGNFKWYPQSYPPKNTLTVAADPAEGGTVIVTWDTADTVTKNENGTYTAEVNSEITVSADANEDQGFKFVSWKTGGDVVIEGVKDWTSPDISFTMPAADFTLTAVFEKSNVSEPETFKVSFDSDGGSTVASQTIKSGEKADKPEDPMKSGYTFAGWFRAGDENEFDFTAAIFGDTVLTARWTKIDTPSNPTPAFPSGGGGYSSFPIVDSDGDGVSERSHKTIVFKVGDPYMIVNGVSKEIDPGRGTVPVILDDRILHPMRAFTEELGGEITWDGSLRTASITRSDVTVVLKIGNANVLINGKTVVSDVAPVIVNARTMFPIRLIAEALGCTVEWDEEARSVTVTSD